MISSIDVVFYLQSIMISHTPLPLKSAANMHGAPPMVLTTILMYPTWERSVNAAADHSFL